MEFQTIAAAGLVASAAVATPVLGVKFASQVLDEGIVDEGGRIVHTREHLPMFALLTLSALAVIVTNLGYSPMTLAVIGFAMLCVPMVLIDVVDYIIPNEVSYGALGIGVAGLIFSVIGPQNYAAGEFPFFGSILPGAELLNGAVQGMCATTFLYVLLHMISSDFGMGDVKLSASSGLILGAFGWEYVVAGFFTTFLSAIIISVLANSAAEGKPSASVTIAFGPYMLLGTLLAFPLAPVVINLFNLIMTI